MTLDRQMYAINHKIITGDVRDPHMWEQLDTHLASIFPHETAGNCGIVASCIDAGDGRIQDMVLDWCKARFRRRIWATKGMGERPGAKWAEIWPGVKPDAARVHGLKVKMIGVNSAKAAIYERLANTEAGTPGYMHFDESWTPDMFAQLTAERLTSFRRGDFSFRKFTLPNGRANEALRHGARPGRLPRAGRSRQIARTKPPLHQLPQRTAGQCISL